MIIPITCLIAFLAGYLYGHKIKPNKQLRATIREVREQCRIALEEGNKGVYKTLVTDDNQTSELVVEVKELAVTEAGQVKVQYISAFYKNPEFRTKKGEALLNEIRDLLGEYLPIHEIEWYETTERHENIKRHMLTLDKTYKKQLRA
jgi:hypothetical protein